MASHTDVSAEIRLFLLSHPGPYCEACLAKETALDARAVKAAFKPSRDNPYSFMPVACSRCEQTVVCVAYAGESAPNRLRQAAASLMSAARR